MSPTAVEPREDGRQDKRVDGYTKFWQKDIGNEARVDTDNRLDNYTDVVNGAFNTTKQLIFFFGRTSSSNTIHRLLRRRYGVLRVRLVEVLPLLTVLQRRGILCFPCSPRALPCIAHATAPRHASLGRWVRSWWTR